LLALLLAFLSTTGAQIVSPAKALFREAEGKMYWQQEVPSRPSESVGGALWPRRCWPFAPDQTPCSSGVGCEEGSMAGEVAAMLAHVSQIPWAELLVAYSGSPERTGEPACAASGPERVQQLARPSILADCMAGSRSGGFGRMKRRRGNSLIRLKLACCWRCTRDSHPAMPSTADSTRRGAGPWYLVRNSSW
jgi:hypothetical protein